MTAAMYVMGTDVATGDVVIRNYGNGTDIHIPKGDIGLIVDMLRQEYPQCEACEGTMVDGYCVACGEDRDGNTRAEETR